jgi:hypothetical protein
VEEKLDQQGTASPLCSGGHVVAYEGRLVLVPISTSCSNWKAEERTRLGCRGGSDPVRCTKSDNETARVTLPLRLDGPKPHAPGLTVQHLLPKL